MMNQLKNNYQFDLSKPLGSPYEDAQVKNCSYKAMRKSDNTQVHLVIYKSTKPGQIHSYHKKLSKIIEIRHPNIVPILECLKDMQNGQLFVILEWNQCYKFRECLKQQIMSEKVAMKLVRDIYEGLSQLHKAGIVHSFVNMENIQIFKGNGRLSFRYLIYKTYYLAPEIKEKHQKTIETDLFSLGVCLFRLLFGSLPFKQKSEDQYIKSVKKGISRKLTVNKVIFPRVISEQVQVIVNTLCHFLAGERLNAKQKIFGYKFDSLIYDQDIVNSALGESYKLLNVDYVKQEITGMTIVNLKQNKCYNMEIIQHNLTQLSTYIDQIIIPFKNSGNVYFANIKEFLPVGKKSIAIVYDYCAQGSLQQFRKNCRFDDTMIREIQHFLKVVLSRWVGQYRFLNDEQILIKKGKPVLKYPPFPIKQLKQRLKKSKDGSYFYAPQLQSGVQSLNADSWSSGVIQYWMRFDAMPYYDKEGILKIQDTKNLSPQQIQQLNSVVVIRAKDRKNLFPLQSKPKTNLQRKISDDSNQSEMSNFNAKIKRSQTIPKNTSMQIRELGKNPSGINQDDDIEILEIEEGLNELSPAKLRNSDKKKIRYSQYQNNQKNVFDRSYQQQYSDEKQKTQNDNKAGKKSLKKSNKNKIEEQNLMDTLKQTNMNQSNHKILSINDQLEGQSNNFYKRENRFSSFFGKDQKRFSREERQMKAKKSIANSNHQSKQKTQKNGSKLPQFKGNDPTNEKVLDNLINESWKFSQIQKHWTKSIRIVFKVIIALLIYLFAFYWSFMKTTGTLLNNRYSYSSLQLRLNADSYSTTATINFTLVTRTPSTTYILLNNQTLNYVLNETMCITNKYWTNSNILNIIQSSSFGTYQASGILIVILNMLLVLLVLAKLDFPKALSLCQFDDNFYIPFYSWIIVILGISTLTSLTFSIYGGLFSLQLDPCISWTTFPSLNYIFKQDISTFLLKFVWVFISIAIDYVVIIYFVMRPKNRVNKYIYAVLLILYLVSLGLRGLASYNSNKESIFGACGELLLLIIGIPLFIVDLIISCKIRKLPSHKANIQQTQQNEIISDLDLSIKK